MVSNPITESGSRLHELGKLTGEKGTPTCNIHVVLPAQIQLHKTSINSNGIHSFAQAWSIMMTQKKLSGLFLDYDHNENTK